MPSKLTAVKPADADMISIASSDADTKPHVNAPKAPAQLAAGVAAAMIDLETYDPVGRKRKLPPEAEKKGKVNKTERELKPKMKLTQTDRQKARATMLEAAQSAMKHAADISKLKMTEFAGGVELMKRVGENVKKAKKLHGALFVEQTKVSRLRFAFSYCPRANTLCVQLLFLFST